MSYDPNDPRRPIDPRMAIRESDGVSAGTIAGIAIALLLLLGVLFWAFTSGDRQTASDTPPATTGQRAPAPSPAPTPERAPSSAPKAQ